MVIGYEIEGEKNETFEPYIDYLSGVQTVLKAFPGWKKNVGKIRNFKDLPEEARNYINFIEDFLKTPVTTISVGSTRNQTVKK